MPEGSPASELARVAQAIVNPRVLDGRDDPPLSPAATIVIGIALERPTTARIDILGHTLIALRAARRGSRCWHAHNLEADWEHQLRCEKTATYRQVVRVAREVAPLLRFAGSDGRVLPPWKRRRGVA